MDKAKIVERRRESLIVNERDILVSRALHHSSSLPANKQNTHECIAFLGETLVVNKLFRVCVCTALFLRFLLTPWSRPLILYLPESYVFFSPPHMPLFPPLRETQASVNHPFVVSSIFRPYGGDCVCGQTARGDMC